MNDFFLYISENESKFFLMLYYMDMYVYITYIYVKAIDDNKKLLESNSLFIFMA